MAWYDYLINPLYGAYKDGAVDYLTGSGQYDPTKGARDALMTQGQNAGNFAQQAQGNYNAVTGQLGQSADALRALASGQNSVSAEQLRQAALANQSQQQSIAASASPANAVMAARNAAQNASRTNYGLAGQQAVAGIQERNQAQSALANLLLGQRGQDASTALGAGQNSINAYGQQMANPKPTEGQQLLNMLTGVAGAAMTKSDRRAKHEIEDGDEESNRAIAGLRAYTFAYKDKRDGKGKQLGVMAQELEKHGLGHAVVNTPTGKMVHGAKLATANTALIAALGRRVMKLEGGDTE
jgi:hypothetical protein